MQRQISDVASRYHDLVKLEATDVAPRLKKEMCDHTPDHSAALLHHLEPDVAIRIYGAAGSTEIFLHSQFLCLVSSFFRAALTCRMRETMTLNIDIRDESVQDFASLVPFLDATNQTPHAELVGRSNVCALLRLADKFDVPLVSATCENFLLRDLRLDTSTPPDGTPPSPQQMFHTGGEEDLSGYATSTTSTHGLWRPLRRVSGLSKSATPSWDEVTARISLSHVLLAKVYGLAKLDRAISAALFGDRQLPTTLSSRQSSELDGRERWSAVVSGNCVKARNSLRLLLSELHRFLTEPDASIAFRPEMGAEQVRDLFVDLTRRASVMALHECKAFSTDSNDALDAILSDDHALAKFAPVLVPIILERQDIVGGSARGQ